VKDEEKIALRKVIDYTTEYYDLGDYADGLKDYLRFDKGRELSGQDMLRLDGIKRNLLEEVEKHNEWKRNMAESDGEYKFSYSPIGHSVEVLSHYQREWEFLHDNPAEIAAYKKERDRIDFEIASGQQNPDRRQISVQELLQIIKAVEACAHFEVAKHQSEQLRTFVGRYREDQDVKLTKGELQALSIMAQEIQKHLAGEFMAKEFLRLMGTLEDVLERNQVQSQTHSR
jgi:hypothetical protein